MSNQLLKENTRLIRRVLELEHVLKHRNLELPAWKDEPICVDFDGVLHHYVTPWQSPEIIPDPPVPGAIEWLNEAVKHFTVHIFSVRSTWPEGIEAIKEWLHEYDAPVNQLSFPTEKPYARIYIDDRAFHFEGEFPSIDEIRNFRPWNHQIVSQ